MAKRKQKEYDLFKVYFCEQGFSQKDAADKAGITEKTAGRWVNENDGELLKLRQSFLTTKSNQLNFLYNQLEELNQSIATRKPVFKSQLTPVKLYKDGTPKEKLPEHDLVVLSNTPTAQEADMIVKITKAIQQLESETNISDTVQVAKDFVQFVRQVDTEKAKEITKLFDLFIKEQMK